MNEYQAIGVIEARYYTTALDIIDIMCKGCEVDFLSAEKYLGGRLVTVIVGGNISNVTQAVETVQLRYGNDRSILKNSLVITRPHSEIMKFIVKQEKEEITQKETVKVEEPIVIESNSNKIEDKLEHKSVVESTSIKSNVTVNNSKKETSIKTKKNKNKKS